MSNLLTSLSNYVSDAMAVGRTYDAATNAKSLSSITKQTTVEPFCVVSRDCVNLDYMVDINNTLLNMFIAYYMQGVSALVNLSDIRTRKLLKAIGTDVSFSLESVVPTVESVQYGLPSDSSGSTIKKMSAGGENAKILQTASDLAVGKLIEIDISLPSNPKDKKSKDRVMTVPVTVRLLVNIAGTRAIEGLLVRYKDDISFTERWYSWKSGRIGFWKDLVFCQDLIRENVKNAIDPDNEIINTVDSRVFNNVMNNSIKAVSRTLAGKPITDEDLYSFGVASNLYVITSAEATKFEFQLKGKLSDQRIREKLFGNGYAMILVVVDPDRERIKFYVQGSDGYTDLSVREIKSAAKGKGPDITDMMKLMQMGTAPTF